MRADRLLSLLMLLQTRGKTPAPWLARELGVSVRTIYRDIEALSMAGIPVYAERGPAGGCALLDTYRTTLTGLTTAEVQALFMLSIPEPLEMLGVGHDLKTALLKLAASASPSQRHDETRNQHRLHLDSSGWFQSEETVPYLSTIQQAVWVDRKLDLVYRLESFDACVERLVMPYGLVAKAGIWHLVCGWREQLRVYRVSRVIEARLSDESFVRPPDFDLADFWRQWCAAYENNVPHFPVLARITPALGAVLPYYFGDRTSTILAEAGPPDAAGWMTVSLPFESFEAARERILGMGCAIQVIEPAALRLSLIDFAQQIVALYTTEKVGPG